MASLDRLENRWARQTGAKHPDLLGILTDERPRDPNADRRRYGELEQFVLGSARCIDAADPRTTEGGEELSDESLPTIVGDDVDLYGVHNRARQPRVDVDTA